MLNLADIKSYFQDNLQKSEKNILREYLQYKILKILFDSKISSNISFIGGTALRIIYNLPRFSEDLDFDNFDLNEKDFNNVALEVKRELTLEGLGVEVNPYSMDGTFHYEIKFPGLLFENKLSPHKNEKILIKVDTQPQGFEYIPDIKLLNKFDVFCNVHVTPIDILLSMKFNAVFNRKRTQGRDFFDIVFLLAKTKPNYDFLRKMLNIENSKELKKELILKCKKLDFKKLAKDLEPLVFNAKEVNRIVLFKEFIEQSEL